MFSIYVHIPFCLSKCSYCDFFSIPVGKNVLPYEGYELAIIEQLKADLGKFGLDGKQVDTIFFGGGTPSLMPPSFFEGVIGAIDSLMNLSSDAEISSEMNPSSVDGEWLRGVRASGVNRVSMGVQSFNHKLLATLGRLHSSDDAKLAMERALKSGYGSVSCDLIYAIPGESKDDLISDLKAAIALGVDHISAYQLTFEEGTSLSKLYASPEMVDDMPGEDEVVEQMDAVLKTLQSKKFGRYEISNYSKPGFECRHNLNYWKYGEYLGLGAGATSFVQGVRFTQTRDLKGYMENLGEFAESESIDTPTAMGEFCFMGLRTIDGILGADFKNRFGLSFDEIYGGEIRGLIEDDLMGRRGDRIYLTSRGLKISNQIFTRFLL